MKPEIQVAVKYISTFGSIIYLGTLTLLFVSANVNGYAIYRLDWGGRYVEWWLLPLIGVLLFLNLYWDVKTVRNHNAP